MSQRECVGRMIKCAKCLRAKCARRLCDKHMTTGRINRGVYLTPSLGHMSSLRHVVAFHFDHGVPQETVNTPDECCSLKNWSASMAMGTSRCATVDTGICPLSVDTSLYPVTLHWTSSSSISPSHPISILCHRKESPWECLHCPCSSSRRPNCMMIGQVARQRE